MTKPRVHEGPHYSRWTPDEDRMALAADPLPFDLRGDLAGQSEITEVAGRLGRTVAAVHQRRSRLTRGIAGRANGEVLPVD